MKETDDTISRQAAIDAIMEEPSETRYPVFYAEKIKQLPSAQHDIVKVVRCKDCKYHDGLDGQCPVQSTGDPFYDYKPDDNWFCADGERRE